MAAFARKVAAFKALPPPAEPEPASPSALPPLASRAATPPPTSAAPVVPTNPKECNRVILEFAEYRRDKYE